jgi:hypothetical protein
VLGAIALYLTLYLGMAFAGAYRLSWALDADAIRSAIQDVVRVSGRRQAGA